LDFVSRRQHYHGTWGHGSVDYLHLLIQWFVECFPQDRHREHSLPSIGLHLAPVFKRRYALPFTRSSRTHLRKNARADPTSFMFLPCFLKSYSQSEYQHSLDVIALLASSNPYIHPALGAWGVSTPFELNLTSHQQPLRERPILILPSLAINMACLIFQEHCGRLSHIPRFNIPQAQSSSRGSYHPQQLHNRKVIKGVGSTGNDYRNEYESRVPY